MNASPRRRIAIVPGLSGQLSIVCGTVASLAGWLLAVGGLVGLISVLPELGWRQVAYLTVLCLAPQAAIWVGRQVRLLRRARHSIPAFAVEQRLHGQLDLLAENDGRQLRPVGLAAGDIAWRTGSLLDKLISIPGVYVFHGVNGARSAPPMVAHVVAAGRTVVLVEAVAWPPGEYRVDASGRVSCNDRYIGQSVNALMDAVGYWRQTLPRSHRVSALVIAYASSGAPPCLPPSAGPMLSWVAADHALNALTERVPARRRISAHSMAALVSATEATQA
jgi:hypothetical protein